MSHALSNASAALADTDGDSVEQLISEQLALVGMEIGCIVATIWDDHPDGKVHRSHVWVNPDYGSVGDYPIEFPSPRPSDLNGGAFAPGGSIDRLFGALRSQ